MAIHWLKKDMHLPANVVQSVAGNLTQTSRLWPTLLSVILTFGWITTNNVNTSRLIYMPQKYCAKYNNIYRKRVTPIRGPSHISSMAIELQIRWTCHCSEKTISIPHSKHSCTVLLNTNIVMCYKVIRDLYCNTIWHVIWWPLLELLAWHSTLARFVCTTPCYSAWPPSFSFHLYNGNTWLCVHWQWNTREWCH